MLHGDTFRHNNLRCLTMKRRVITIRIMWSNERDKDFVAEVARLVFETLRKYRFKSGRSKVYRNTGVRVYIAVSAQIKRRKKREEQYEEHSQ